MGHFRGFETIQTKHGRTVAGLENIRRIILAGVNLGQEGIHRQPSVGN